jgi:hypothetical protein
MSVEMPPILLDKINEEVVVFSKPSKEDYKK